MKDAFIISPETPLLHLTSVRNKKQSKSLAFRYDQTLKAIFCQLNSFYIECFLPCPEHYPSLGVPPVADRRPTDALEFYEDSLSGKFYLIPNPLLKRSLQFCLAYIIRIQGRQMSVHLLPTHHLLKHLIYIKRKFH